MHGWISLTAVGLCAAVARGNVEVQELVELHVCLSEPMSFIRSTLFTYYQCHVVAHIFVFSVLETKLDEYCPSGYVP